MEKYLFTDGTNGVREVQSLEELKTLIESSNPSSSPRIWLFNNNEWVSYSVFLKNQAGNNGKTQPEKRSVRKKKKDSDDELLLSRAANSKRWLKKFLVFFLAVAAIFLIYNFTKIRWGKAMPLNILSARPENAPAINVDSLVQYLEESRGQKLDRITKTNLRIRDEWPERITLQLHADRDTSNIGSKYYNIDLSIDNSTGYNIDNAIVKLNVWKHGEISNTDTFHFSNISYANAATRSLEDVYRGDSLSVSFQSIKAKVFNFCYSADKKSNYGNNNDRWFCRE